MVLETARLLIRPLRHDDLTHYHDLNSDPRNFTFEKFGPLSLDQSTSILTQWIEIGIGSDGLFGTTELAIELTSEKRLIGVIDGIYSDQHSGILQFGIMVNYNYCKLGYAFEAAQAFIDYAFSDANIHRIFSTTDARNIASIRLFEKLKMTNEGLLRKNLKMPDDKYYDEVIYAILVDEYNEIKSA